jgi:hypothetical protein
MQKTGRQAEVEPLIELLDGALHANDFVTAEAVADPILQLLYGN